MNVLGICATITSLGFMAMGLPAQIWKIHKAKSTQGVSLLERRMLLLTTLTWCVYSLFGEERINWYILTANAPGAFFAVVILYQFWVYRDSGESKCGSAFQITSVEMDQFIVAGEIHLEGRGFSLDPYVGQKMDIVCDDHRIRQAELTAWEADFGAPVNRMYDVTLRLIEGMK